MNNISQTLHRRLKITSGLRSIVKQELTLSLLHEWNCLFFVFLLDFK